VLVQTFDEGLRRLTPEEFAQRVLVGELQARFVAIGDSHTFGAGGGGTPERMQQLGHSMGFEVSVVPLVCLGELCVSSTAIRKALAQGDLGRAQAMLGRPYTLTGTVVRGHGLGQGLGAPTANLEPPADKLLPASGVYAAAAVLGDGEAGPYAAALTYGPAPTLDIAEPRLEVHLLDFEGDLYGQEVTVALLERLRPLETFDSREALIEQIARDLKRVRAVYEQGLRVP
jgi:riboflavin kinase/FMN adenylyltransferase